MGHVNACRYRCSEWCYCVVVRRLTPLLRRIGCVASETTAGSETERVLRARGSGGGACNAPLRCCVQSKGVYEKVGEATETALTVLVEKMNPYDVDKSSLAVKDLGTACSRAIQAAWKKEFTLEFSRDRKSMSCFCQPLKATKLGPGPKMFVKVWYNTIQDITVRYSKKSLVPGSRIFKTSEDLNKFF